MLEDLTWDNFLKINALIHDKKYIQDYFSPIQLILWKCYGIDLKFHITNDTIIFYCHKKNNWSLFQSWYTPNFDLNSIKEIVKKDLWILNKNETISITDVSKKMIIDWKLSEIEFKQLPYITNYLYNFNDLKNFAGRKMQKKRNHLNAFLKAQYNIKTVDIRDVDVDQLINFTKELQLKYNKKIDGEIKSYQELFKLIHTNNTFYGTVYFIDDKIVAYTLGFLNYNVYEILIEKCIREIRGLFPYVISNNIVFFNLRADLIDRLDDASDQMLAKSKLSYHPVNIIERYYCDNIKW